MARVRTFVAVDVAKSVKQRLKTLQETLSGEGAEVRWVPPDNYHLTLMFLGEVEKLEIVSVCKIVAARAKKHGTFSLQFGGLGAFPHARRPKILWAGISEGAEQLGALQADIEEGLLARGAYRREDRGFTPHLTLGRLTKSEKSEEWAPILERHADWKGGNSNVAEVLVMASDYEHGDTQYTVLGRAPLIG